MAMMLLYAALNNCYEQPNKKKPLPDIRPSTSLVLFLGSLFMFSAYDFSTA